MVPTAARISTADAVQCATAFPLITVFFTLSSATWPSGAQSSRSCTIPCTHQLCTMDAFRPSLSAISRKENPPSRSPITRPRSNSIQPYEDESCSSGC
ncbi:hypothetical protein TNCV_26271 [Trichonephila clavipes]|uniref:Uncharacterized protein n=1 Tax=Trichonephila clavipes TaxID=2585209 RepID=A0A8X7BC28_TRICX|nr:hypothetical protein TNCV_26271 [Trichonephila clavipes]